MENDYEIIKVDIKEATELVKSITDLSKEIKDKKLLGEILKACFIPVIKINNPSIGITEPSPTA